MMHPFHVAADLIRGQRHRRRLGARRQALSSQTPWRFLPLRRSRQLTRLCSPKLTQGPPAGGDDNGLAANGLAAVPPRPEWVTLSKRKWVNCRERRGSARSDSKSQGDRAPCDCRRNRPRRVPTRRRHTALFHRRMNEWRAIKSRRVPASLRRIVRMSGSYRTLWREG